jgi:hypothetical protein
MGQEETRELKRWLSWVLGLVIALVSAIWGLTWGNTLSSQNRQEERLREIELRTEGVCVRYENIEKSVSDIKTDVREIKQILSKGR